MQEMVKELYREGLKNRKSGKKAPQIFCSERGAVFENTTQSENEKYEVKPTQPGVPEQRLVVGGKAQPETDFSIMSDIMPEEEVENFYAYGFAQYGSGNWNEAADTFRVLCTRRPFEPRFWFALGATLQEAGSYKEALHSWAMAALLKKEDPYPHFHAAECAFSLRDEKDALLALNESEARIQADPHHPLKTKIGLLKQQWRL